MKKIIVTLSFIGIIVSELYAQVDVNQQSPTNQRKIQMAILFDASGSMEGLLSQAKARIWSIVNELATMRYEGTVPSIEIALYSYGNDGHPSLNNYIQQLVPLSKDLDLISEQLFSIVTNGGSEFCGAVISNALTELNWSSSSEDLRMIYIAGNEPFNQGSIDYKKICPEALRREIFVNTIHCGDYETGVKHFWLEAAQLAGGDFFNIDANKSIQHIATPFDDTLNALNDSINTTYFGFGAIGIERKILQAVQDENAGKLSPSSQAERCISKSKDNYENSSWDLIDAYKQGKVDFSKLKDEDLPAEFKGFTVDEKEEIVKIKAAKRQEFQKKVAEVAIQRDAFLHQENSKKGDKTEDDFGTSVNKCIQTKAAKIGYKKEVN